MSVNVSAVAGSCGANRAVIRVVLTGNGETTAELRNGRVVGYPPTSAFVEQGGDER